MSRSVYLLKRRHRERRDKRLMGGPQGSSGVRVSLGHLKLLTDSVGVVQHAFFGIPRRYTGYTTDDNARALIVVCWYSSFSRDEDISGLSSTYLSFLHHAQQGTGWFHNFMTYHRIWMDTRRADEDTLGRAFWALAEVGASSLPEPQKEAAKNMLDDAMPALSRLSSSRGIALALLGLTVRNKTHPHEPVQHLITSFAETLCDRYEVESSQDWHWFESCMAYGNGRIPQALLAAYRATNNKRFLEIGLEATSFLTDVTFVDDVLQPIGNDGWFEKANERAFYDQQPVDAGSSVELYVEAFRATNDPRYAKLAERALAWYLGDNVHRQNLVDLATGSCCDGLTPYGLNRNRGAEACVTFLMAALAANSIASNTGV